MLLNNDSLYRFAGKLNLEPRRYYAFVETVDDVSIEASQVRLFVRFDCIQIGDASRIGRLLQPNLGLLQEIPFISIECIEPIEKWVQYFGQLEIRKAESKWMIIETIAYQQEGIAADEFYNGDAQDLKHSVIAAEPTSEENEMMVRLEDALDLGKFGSSTESQISQSFGQQLSNIDSLVVANVGQGSLVYLVQGGFPSVYSDMGGGTGKNKFTYPQTLRTCKTRSPVVLLSHWDMDHIETAIRDMSNCSLTWLAPIQRVGKTHYTLALAVVSSGSLLLWPPSLKSLIGADFTIYKCTGATRNDSGLALEIEIRQQRALLPGDAVYSAIPLSGQTVLNWLVASHHGSNSSQLNVPLASNAHGWIVYSFGRNNTYGHSTVNAINSHALAGWVTQKDTPNGSVVFSTKPYVSPCGDSRCDLSSVQVF